MGIKVLTVTQNKGGVGKTTISRLVIEYLGRKGVRILAIDLDPQCNLSRRLMNMEYSQVSPEGVIPPMHPDFSDEDKGRWTGRSSSADIFLSGGVYPYPAERVGLENVDVVPADGDNLRRVEMVTEENVTRKVHQRMHEFTRLEEVQREYDLVVIDTSPSKGPLTVSAIQASTDILIPTVMEPQSIEGLYGMLGLWRSANRHRSLDDRIRILGIVPNQYRRQTTLHHDILQGLREEEAIAPYLADFEIGQRVVFSETDHPDALPTSVFDLPPSNTARQEAEMLGAFVAKRLGFDSGDRG